MTSRSKRQAREGGRHAFILAHDPEDRSVIPRGPDDPEACYCRTAWQRNQVFYLGQMAWWCPVHKIVFPDEEGNPMPDEYAIAIEAGVEAERLMKQKRAWAHRQAVIQATQQRMAALDELLS